MTIITEVIAKFVILTFLWRRCDVQWRQSNKNVAYFESVDQDLWFDILHDIVLWSVIFSTFLTLDDLFKVKVKGQDEGSIWRPFINTITWIWFEVSMIITTEVIDIYVNLTFCMTLTLTFDLWPSKFNGFLRRLTQTYGEKIVKMHVILLT